MCPPNRVGQALVVLRSALLRMVTVRVPVRWLLIPVLCWAASAWSGPYEDGVSARNRGDFVEALRLFKPLAGAGDAASQFQLSLLYASGQGVSADLKESLYWLRKAALRGHAQAQSNLGVAFSKGRGVMQDDVKAYAWFSMAASAGDSIAVTNQALAARRLSPQQLEQAKALALACSQGNFKGCQ